VRVRGAAARHRLTLLVLAPGGELEQVVDVEVRRVVVGAVHLEDADVGAARPWLLGVKWPGYWRYLGRLPGTRFIGCLRDPTEVIASFKAAGGRVAEGLQYETRFNCDLNRDLLEVTGDPALRRVLLFEYVHRRLLPHLGRPDVLVVRYERWFQDRDALMGEIGQFLGRTMTPGRVELRKSSTVEVLSPRDRELIAAHCSTAAELGYLK